MCPKLYAKARSTANESSGGGQNPAQSYTFQVNALCIPISNQLSSAQEES